MYADISSVKFPTHRGDNNFHFSLSQIRFTSRISSSDVLICVMIHINSTLTKAERDDDRQHIALHNQLNSWILANDDTPSEAEIFTAYQFHSEYPKTASRNICIYGNSLLPPTWDCTAHFYNTSGFLEDTNTVSWGYVEEKLLRSIE